MKLHYFIGTKCFPHHLSVGAVLMNAKRQVYCHHLRNVQKKTELFFLMRETVRPNESLEQTLRRGLKEEFGVRAKPLRYLGSLESAFVNWEGVRVHKTTLYFLCKPLGVPRKHTTTERHYSATGAPEWQSVPFLIRQMRRQAKILKRTDFDESEIFRRI